MMISEMQLQRVHRANLLGKPSECFKGCHRFSMVLEMSKTYIDHWSLNKMVLL